MLTRLFLFKACFRQLEEEVGADLKKLKYIEDREPVDAELNQYQAFGNVNVDDPRAMNVDAFKDTDKTFRQIESMDSNYLPLMQPSKALPQD